MSTWAEDLITELAGLGAEFNTVLAAAELPELVDWYTGEPKPLRMDSTPFGWFHFRPGGGVTQQRTKQSVGSVAPFLLGVVIAGGTSAELMANVAGTMPRLAAHLESRTWPCSFECGDWELAAQDDQLNVDIYVMPLTLTYWRAYGSA